MFLKRFLVHLTDFLSGSPDSQVLIVPSVQDIVSDHAVYPQGELKMKDLVDPVCFAASKRCY